MQISDILSRDVETIPPDASICDAAMKMRDRDIGSLPVCDGRKIVGMVTDRDIAVRAVAEGMDPQSARVRDVMTAQPVYCFEDEDVREAARIMEEKQIRRLPILSRDDKRLVGIVALGDIALTGDDRLSGDVLQHVSQPTSHPHDIH